MAIVFSFVERSLSGANADYIAVSRVITFPAAETNVTVPVLITNDLLYELDENFTAMISEIEDDTFVIVTEPLTTVQIINDDSKSQFVSIS